MGSSRMGGGAVIGIRHQPDPLDWKLGLQVPMFVSQLCPLKLGPLLPRPHKMSS